MNTSPFEYHQDMLRKVFKFYILVRKYYPHDMNHTPWITIEIDDSTNHDTIYSIGTINLTGYLCYSFESKKKN